MSIKSFCKKHKVALIIVFAIDLFLPDPIPLLDEFIIGIFTIYGWI